MIVKVGDLFEITLSDGRVSRGHYVHADEKYGPFIQVFNCIKAKGEMKVEEANTPAFYALTGMTKRGK